MAQPTSSASLAVQYRPLAALIPYACNARTHSEAQIGQIATSMVEFGWTNPILVDGEGNIIAGHGRVLAARLLGMNEVPVIELLHLSPVQRRALVLADNRIAENAGWDEEVLRLELEALRDEGFDLDLTGFDDAALAELLEGDEPTNEGQTDEDAVPEVRETTVSRSGDLWLLGEHRLLCGDSTQIAAVQKLMDQHLADLLYTDPPYGVSYSGRGENTSTEIQNDHLTGDALLEFLSQAFASADASIKPGAACYVWHADGHHGTRPVFEKAFVDVGWHFSSTIIWAKNQASMGWQDYRQQHEPCLYGWKTGSRLEVNDRTQTTLWQVKRDPASTYVHPTQKPVELAERAIRNSSRPGEAVLDCFGGSGSTLIAAHKAGRRARLMELDPKYVDVIVRRWEDFTGQKAIREAADQQACSSSTDWRAA